MSIVQRLPFDVICALCGWLHKPTLIALNTVSKYLFVMTVDLVWAQVTLGHQWDPFDPSLPHKGNSWDNFEGIITLLRSPRRQSNLIKCLQVNVAFVPIESEAIALRRVSNIIHLLNEYVGPYAPPLAQFLKAMTSLESFTMT